MISSDDQIKTSEPENFLRLGQAGFSFFHLITFYMTHRLMRFVSVLLCAGAMGGLSSCTRSDPADPEDTGVQQGRFGASGQFSLCSGFSGTIEVIRGGKQTSKGYPAGTDSFQNLIYIFSGFPGAQLAASYSEDAQFTTTFSNTWKTPTNSWTTSFVWDRRSDTVTSGGKVYRRSQGNVLVFTRGASGHPLCCQLPALGPAANCRQAIAHIRRYLPQDKFVQTLLTQLENPDEAIPEAPPQTNATASPASSH
jgi:hypothetical protein